ncbi:hypothetical protein CTEN210_17825 [Chaetoceros tenuissimus]|uniref:Uncharacterized protein n=1 Tax=Chaetoceros tenuissimus TaxID=426638 RepID=A0AAD3DEU3_9STRA|nr:hypothetical protein CTEN210_17825 [Chaetoceros tenuissimus]
MPDSTKPNAVSVRYLSTKFLEEVKDSRGSRRLGRESKIYEIEDLSKDEYGVIRKKGVEKKSSYVDCLNGKDNVGEATHMLSYSWGYTIGDIIDSLDHYCENNEKDKKRTYEWICCLNVNQHDVVKFRKEGKAVPFEDFSNEFYQRVKGIKHILAMMAPWKDPGYLERAWCVYEMFVATTSPECNVAIIMPPKEGNQLAKDIENGQGGNIVFQVLFQTNVEKAKTFPPCDKERIMEEVNKCIELEALNSKINKKRIDWIKSNLDEAIKEREEACSDSTDDNLSFARFLRKVGLLFYKQGYYIDAWMQQINALNIQKRLLGEDDRQIAHTYNDIGLTYHELSKLKQKNDTGMTSDELKENAYESCNKALQIRKKIFKDTMDEEAEKDVAASLCNVAMRLISRNDVDEAKEMAELALEIRKEYEDPADMCRSEITLGRVYAAGDDNSKAIEHFEVALDWLQKSEEDQRLKARVLYAKGKSYQKLEEKAKAVDAFKKCLVIRTQIFGPDHKKNIEAKDKVEKLTSSKLDL